jgi:protease-4
MTPTRALRAATLLLSCLPLAGCAFVVADLNPFGGRPEQLREQVVEGEGKPKILLIDISRTIGDEERDPALGLRRRESTVARVKEELRKAEEDDRVQAVVLRINSPGGTVTASDILYHELRAFSARRKVPIVAQCLDVATSGAYYAALAADEIVAQPTTVTGSIGVIMFGLNVEGLLDKLGVRNQTLKAGTHKDIGSPLRAMTPDDERILQGILDDMRGRFVQLVQERRPGAKPDMLPSVTDGRVITAGQALEAGLIDRIGYLDDALAVARQRAGVTTARVVVYRRPSEFGQTIYSIGGGAPAQVNLMNVDLGGLLPHGPAFMYLWAPTADRP